MHRQEGQAPKLYDIALGRRERAQRYRLVPVIVAPAPDLATQLSTILVDRIPKRSVGIREFAVKGLATEIYEKVSHIQVGKGTL